MIPAKLAGALILGVPLILIARMLLRRQPRAIFLFAVALILVGLGYLAATGDTDDIAAASCRAAFYSPQARSIAITAWVEHIAGQRQRARTP
jgi:hypothetical protein